MHFEVSLSVCFTAATYQAGGRRVYRHMCSCLGWGSAHCHGMWWGYYRHRHFVAGEGCTVANGQAEPRFRDTAGPTVNVASIKENYK